MRGGRNKFGQIYRRDRALRRQIRTQLQNNPDLEAVAKAAATATLAKADLEAIAKVTATATVSKAAVDGLRSYDILVSQPASMSVLDVDLKPDVVELCGLTTGRHSVSNYDPLHSAADLPATNALKSSAASSYLTAVTQSTASDPLTGLSGMAAALLSQFLRQQRGSLPATSSSVNSLLTSVPRVVHRPSTTAAHSVVTTQALASHTDAQNFNCRLPATSHCITSQKSAIPVIHTLSHPVTPQQHMIPVMQTLSSPVTPQQPVISAVNTVLHPVTPRQSVIPTVHITSDISESVVSSVSLSSVQQLPPLSSSSSSELQLSSLEPSGVPATLRLIFDLKRQTTASSRLTESSSDRLRRFVEDLLQQPVMSVTSSMETAIQRAIALACRVCDQQLFLLVDWARQAHFFRHLMVKHISSVCI